MQGYLPQRQERYTDKPLNICPLHLRLLCYSNLLGSECCSTVSRNDAYRKRIEVISLLFLFGGTILAAGIIDADLSGIPWQGWAWGMASAVSFASFVMINSKTSRRNGYGNTSAFHIVFRSNCHLLFPNTGNCLERNIVQWRFMDIRLDSRIVRDCHSDLSLFNCSAESWDCDDIDFKCSMELPVAVTASVILLSEALTSIPSYWYYHYRNRYDVTDHCAEKIEIYKITYQQPTALADGLFSLQPSKLFDIIERM